MPTAGTVRLCWRVQTLVVAESWSSKKSSGGKEVVRLAALASFWLTKIFAPPVGVD